MNINIISVGRVREKYIRHGIDEFLKRLTTYSSVKITEIQAEELATDAPTEKILQKEAERIFNKIKENTYVIVLDRQGEKMSSEKFAQKLGEISTQGVNQLAFVLGSSEGLAEDVKKRADFVLSVSEMTFPHQLMRLILLEQIYRAFRILNNEPYHK
jgi:23S rRNA (pseudouridine1915-N3)-methyltransferase